MIPKDVFICDWHYERADLTGVYFATKGFNVASCGYRNPDICLQQISDMARFRKQSAPATASHLQGYIHTIWSGNAHFLKRYYEQKNTKPVPDAQPDDGLLDVLVASPRTVRDWVRLVTQVVTRRERGDDQLDRLTGRRVEITVEPRDQYQLDGDTAGECATLVAEIVPGALTVRVPPAQQRSLTTADATDLAGDTDDVSSGDAAGDSRRVVEDAAGVADPTTDRPEPVPVGR
jgi:hypothetical protein